MTDKELLELAAKAAGIESHPDGIYWTANELGDYWLPLKDDGDALRLAVKLRMDLMLYSFCKGAFVGGTQYAEDGEKDPYAATRRAIVRAAAEIGKTL